MKKAIEGHPVTHQHGNLLITTSVDHTGLITLYVTDGVNRLDQLCKAFTDRDAAAAWYRHIRDCAVAGKPVYAIEWELEALIAAGVAVDVEQVAEQINTDADTRQATTEAAHDALVADRDDIMADADPNWRTKLRQQTAAQANRRTIRPTRTRVHLQPPTPAQKTAAAQHRDGVVYAADVSSWVVLRGLEERGYGLGVRETPNRPKLAYLTLNTAGLTLADTMERAA